MKKFLKFTGLLLLVALFSVSCSRFQQNMSRNVFDNHPHDVKVTLFSGGKAVKTWDLKNAIISNSEGSDGYYFYYKGKLVEISGDIVIEYQD